MNFFTKVRIHCFCGKNGAVKIVDEIAVEKNARPHAADGLHFKQSRRKAIAGEDWFFHRRVLPF